MRFLIGCVEICGLINAYSEELKKKGHSVISIADTHPFYNYTYTYANSTLAYSFFTINGKPGFFKKLFFRVSETIEKRFPDFRHLLILSLLRKQFDVYIYIWKGIVGEEQLFKKLKKYRKKVVVLFLGDDVRHFSALSQEFDVSHWTFPEDYVKRPIVSALKKLRYAERYADLIYSVPDQMGLAIKPYKHLHIPIRVESFNYVNNLRQAPRVLHLPSEPFIKGSDMIMAALQELKAEGLDFEVVYKSKIPFTEVKVNLEEADILVDELIFHGPGVLAFEAMASGCSVATNCLEEHREIFGPPVCCITPATIKTQLRTLIMDYEYRQQLIRAGYDFVKANNNIEKIVDNVLQDLEDPKAKMDYQPVFYLTEYKNEKDKPVLEKIDKILNQ